jgi:hypothetical protein
LDNRDIIIPLRPFIENRVVLKMEEIGIEINLGYEDDTMLCLQFTANNGRFQGQFLWYCYPNELKEIGNALSTFPKKVPDEYLFELGSPQDRVNYLYNFALHAYTYDKSGHSALEITIKVNYDKPEEEECRFSIKAEAWAFHRLGEQIIEFSKLKYSLLKWSLNPDNDILLENK